MDNKTRTWFELAQGDLEFAGEILAGKKRPHYAAHFCHQAIEKLLKAIIQQKTQTTPLPTHNFKSLCSQAGLSLPQNRLRWLLDLAPHYLGARYPEDLFQLQKQYTQKFCEHLFVETKEMFKWLTAYLK